jgi:GNAT superfamily N-acetyltransferase
MTINYHLRRATPGDTGPLVDLHYRVFDAGTHRSTVLGRGFIVSAYAWYATASEAFSVIAATDRGIVGCAAVHLGSYYRVFRVNWRVLVPAVVSRPGLWLEPWLWRRLAVLPGRTLSGSRGWECTGSRAYLAWLAVDPVARRQGIGEALLSACARECETRGWRELGTAVHQENEAAQCLYRRLGFEPEPSTAPGLIALRREISSWFGRKALT